MGVAEAWEFTSGRRYAGSPLVGGTLWPGLLTLFLFRLLPRAPRQRRGCHGRPRSGQDAGLNERRKMPYIKHEDRVKLDFAIGEVVYALKQTAPDVFKRPGPTNYTITRIVAAALKPDEGWSYHSLSRAIAVLRDAAAEMQRRLMDQREDHVIRENGDVPEYAEATPGAGSA